MNRFLLTLLILIFSSNFSLITAQVEKGNLDDLLISRMGKIVKTESKRDWIKFKQNTSIVPANVFTQFKEAFDLKENDKMLHIRTEHDELGFSHYKFQQYYKNIEVDGGIYFIHSNKTGFAHSGNGKILTNIVVDVTPLIKNETAIELALKYVSADEYMWESRYWENELKERTGNSDSTYFPRPQLVIRKLGTNIKANENPYFLAYRLDIYSSTPHYSQRIFIDAKTGVIIDQFPLQST